MDNDQNKNLILATILSFIVLLIWFVFFPPEQPAPTSTTEEAVAAAPMASTPTAAADSATTGAAPEALADVPRIAIDTPALSGALSLRGGRIDQLALKDYHKTVEGEESVELLKPVGMDHAYYALYGWMPGGDLPTDAVPDANTDWTLVSGETLTPQTPITLEWQSPQGLTFSREISVDDKFLFTVTQRVANTGATPVRLAPYGIVARHGEPEDLSRMFIIHEGMIRMADGQLEEMDYKDLTKLDVVAREGTPAEVSDVTENGWIGFSDHYWMTSLIPAPGQPFTQVAKYAPGADIYQTEARMPVMEVAPGASAEAKQFLFAGAKEWEAIRDYERTQGIDRFVDSIDWGWFFFLTKPIFRLLHFLHGLIGNMGLSIIALTLVIKAILMPLAYKSYVSMAKMKELQPKMEALKERVGDDRQKMQQEMMQLYKTEKVNPAAGCLPLILQIPIFFSLYKVIAVTLELRHAPFFGWLKDLSAPDPSSLFNLFGLLPWGVPESGTLLATAFIGALPILLGLSMWLQQKLNPAPTDPTQKMIFGLMPWVFMFMLGRFASGLVLYWITNNTITFLQQYGIMSSHGHRPDLFGNIRSSFKRGSAKTESAAAKKKG